MCNISIYRRVHKIKCKHCIDKINQPQMRNHENVTINQPQLAVNHNLIVNQSRYWKK